MSDLLDLSVAGIMIALAAVFCFVVILCTKAYAKRINKIVASDKVFNKLVAEKEKINDELIEIYVQLNEARSERECCEIEVKALLKNEGCLSEICDRYNKAETDILLYSKKATEKEKEYWKIVRQISGYIKSVKDKKLKRALKRKWDVAYADCRLYERDMKG